MVFLVMVEMYLVVVSVSDIVVVFRVKLMVLLVV